MVEQIEKWLSDKIVQLENPPKKDALIEIKSRLTHIDNNLLIPIALKINLAALFDGLTTAADEEEILLFSEVLCLLLNAAPPAETLNVYGLAIQGALNHPSTLVKRNFLKLLLKFVDADCLLLFTSNQAGVLNQIIECLACPDRSIAEGSVLFFKHLGKTLQGAQILLSDAFVPILKRIMQVDDITRFRIYEIIVDVSVRHEGALDAAHQSGILPSLLSELKSSDTLVQLNALELLTSLTSNSSGLLYLQREGVIKYLGDKILNLDDEPILLIFLPGLIEFFGNLYKLQPIVFSQQHPGVLPLLFRSFDTIDPVLRGVTVSTVGKIGSSDEGKSVLVAHNEQVVSFFKKMGEIIQKKDSLCVIAMDTLSVLLKTEQEPLFEATRKWFDSLGPGSLLVIFETAHLPFVELRLSALKLLNAIASQPWGTEEICTSPGFLEFLLDRDAEFDKDCKIGKHEIVKTIVKQPCLGNFISSDMIIKLKTHIKEGPFYVQADLLTAVEQA